MCLSANYAWALRRDTYGVYQIETAQDLMDFSALVNAGSTGISAVLTDDIDMGAIENFAPIGTQTINYAGTFDGQGHIISNLSIISEQMFVGLFGSVTGGAVIKNTTLRNALLTGNRFVAFIGAGVGSGTVVLDCLGFEGKATATTKDAAGIVGAMSGPTFTVTNCYVTGSMTAASEAASMTGYSNVVSNTFTNCWSSAEIVGHEAGKPFYRGAATIKNCYDQFGYQATMLPNDMLSSGELCYKLNGDQSQTVWYQTLGQDAHPVLDASRGKVYTTAELRCDGVVLSQGGYTNDADKASSIPPHNFVDGVCTVCGQKDGDYMKPDAEGFYSLGSASELLWFASLVNAGESGLNARLVSDIDMSGVENFTPIGSQALNYSGTFDGQGHVISGLTVEGQMFIGLFATVTGGAVLKNFTLKNVNLSGERFVGIVGAGLGSGFVTIENVGFEGKATASTKGVAGIVGSMSGPVFTVKNCYVKGNISAPAEAEAITSYSNNASCTFINCWSTVELTGYEGGHPFYRGSAVVTNCYNQYGMQATLLTDELLSGGELCYNLNGDQSQIVWFQTLEEDDTPLLESSHAIVYTTAPKRCDGQVTGDGMFTNDAEKSSVAPPHTYQDGVCTVCGQKDPGFMVQDEEGYYHISNSSQLAWFAAAVNNGEPDLKACLAADIDMAGAENFTPIGTQSTYFSGTFDGQGHIIHGLTIESSGMYIGLFGCVTGGAVIKDFTLKGAHLTGYRFVATIGAGMGEGAIVMERVGFEGEATATFKDASGLVGAMTGPVFNITDCYVVGTITAGAEAAAITGYSNIGTTTFTNCWSSAEIVGNEEGRPFFRGSARVENCYNQYGLQADELTDKLLSTGELCYSLNGDQRQIVWHQTLGTDPHPVFDKSHGRVFTTAPIRCDGGIMGDGSYTNDASQGTAVPDHSFVNGICTVCGLVEGNLMEPDENGFYNIGTAGQLIWFAKAVNGGKPSLKGRLVADIDMDGMGKFFQPIGTQSLFYSGTFDGQGHIIRNLTIESDGMYIGLFGCVTGEADIQNFTLKDAHLTGYRFVAIIGAGMGTGIVRLDRLGFEGEATATYRDAAGIVGVMSGPTFFVTNCYATGNISAETEAASMTAYSNVQQTTFTNCWSTAELQGVEGVPFFRGNALAANCYDQYGTQVAKLELDELTDGEFCYRMNDEGFANPIWYQTLQSDSHPVLDATHGIVYKIGDTYKDVHDEASFAEFKEDYVTAELEYSDMVIAEQTLIDQYVERLESVNETYRTMKEFSEAYGGLESLRRRIESSAKAYTAFRNKVEQTRVFLDENTNFQGEKRDLLADYLTTNEEPGGLFPNGTALYILETHTLSETNVKAETEWIDQLLKEAIAEDYQPHTDITSMLANADFGKGYTGWDGTPGNRVSSPNAECRNSVCDFHQTLTGLKNGIYELRVDGFFRPGNPRYPEGNVESTNYGAMLYTNGVQNYLMAAIEDMVTANDAVDGVNCYLTNTAQSEQTDYPVYGEGEAPVGYVPNGMTGLSFAVKGGRYSNRVVANVTDGTLTVGFRMPGTGITNDCMDIANVRLYYHGTLDEAGAELDDALECMAARARTLCEYEPSDMDDYAEYPSFDANLRQGLQETIEAISSTTDAEGKYALAERFSELFQQVYESKKQYVRILQKSEKMENILAEITPLLSSEEADELYLAMMQIYDSYMAGTASDEMIDGIFNTVSFVPAKQDGVYQIKDGMQLIVFSLLVNNGESTADAQLVGDIDMSSYAGNVYQPIGTQNIYYAGTFDGQGHVIHGLTVESEGMYIGLFGCVTGGAALKNFTLKDTHLTGNRFVGIIGAGMGGGSVVLDCLGFEGEATATFKDASGIIGVMSGPVFTVTNCYATGTITAEAEAAGITGYSNNGSSSFTNCWSSAGIVGYEEEKPFYRGAARVVNCYNQYGMQASELNSDMLSGGELCYRLNGDQSQMVWYQTLGQDAHPVLDASHGEVTKNDDGTFANATGISNVPEPAEQGPEAVYDLSGRRVEKTAKGVYIVNGKKIVK